MLPMRARLAAALLCLFAAGCFLLPGKFASELTVKRDGTFGFTYQGDIHVLALSKLAQDERGQDAKFEPQTCYVDDTGDERPCNADELSTQRSDWETGQEASKASKKKQAEMARQMLGGIDPVDPRAAEELAERMRKQAGWRSVQYVGDGKYVVAFAISGRLDHDFSFPSIERLPMLTPFVAIYRRADGTVRIDAPAYSASASGGPVGAMMQGMGADKATPQGMPELDGSFAILTDAEILANNTDVGAQPGTAGMRRLSWTVNSRTTAAPTALIKLAK